MNSDLMPSPESSNTTASNQVEPTVEVIENVTLETDADKENCLHLTPSDTNSDGKDAGRLHPIPPPSEPMQYRAIGLVRGSYFASSEQFTQGTLVTVDNVSFNAVLLGRIMSLVKNHLDLEQEHLWVVYPRTRQEEEGGKEVLHLQIVGVWEPEKLAKKSAIEPETSLASSDTSTVDEVTNEAPFATTSALTPSSSVPDGGFSVRGEVVYQSFEAESLVVKIKQAPRKPDDKPKYFKLKLKGRLETKAVSKFFDFQVQRVGENLVIEKAECIADLPRKRKPPFNNRKGGGPRKPFKGGGPGGGFRKPYPPRRSPGGETPRPVKRGETPSPSAPPQKPYPNRPTPKPVKRPKPEE